MKLPGVELYMKRIKYPHSTFGIDYDNNNNKDLFVQQKDPVTGQFYKIKNTCKLPMWK